MSRESLLAPQLFPSFDRTYTYTSINHSNNLSSKVMSFYHTKMFFDIILDAGFDNVEIEAHKIVLSASSDFFLRMFSSDMTEGTAERVELKEFDGATWKSIIDFMYTGSIELRSDTVEFISQAADFLQMDDVVDACCTFMGQQLDASNCLGVAFFAEQHKYVELQKIAFTFAYAFFDKVWIEKEFVELSEEQLKMYLSSNELCTHSEKQVFHSLVAWLEHDRESRNKCAFNLLPTIRFTFLEPEFIIENKHLVCLSKECDKLVSHWLQFHSSPESSSLYPMQEQTARKQNFQYAFASGGYANNMKVQTYNDILSTWCFEDLPSPPMQRTEFGVIVIKRKLIVVGGKVHTDETNCVECLDLDTKEWTVLTPMKEARCNCALANVNGDLYVVGGRIGDTWTRTMEKYEFSTGEWQTLTSLRLPLAWVSVDVYDRFLYAVGGGYHVLECYDPDSNEWYQKKRRNKKVVLFGFATMGKYIYAVGGYDQEIECPSDLCERYDPRTDTWTYISAIHRGRDFTRCIAMGNRLLACGGFVGNISVDLVDEYNPETNEWNALAPLLTHEIRYCHTSLFIM